MSRPGLRVSDCEVLIVGAGPTGLVLALWLTRLGVRVRIIDRTAAPGTTSRALAVQARTLELYRQLDLTGAVLERGHQVPAVNLWVRGERAARVTFEAVGADLTPYPFLHIFPQDEHERLLIERLQRLGVSVERQTELLAFSDDGQRVTARLRTAAGQETDCLAGYIAGCDGARSRVREVLGSGYPGGTYRQLFYVADIDGVGPPFDGGLHIDLDEADFLALFPLAGAGRARLIGTVRDERAEHPETLRFEDVSRRAIESLKVAVRQVNWFSTYHVHHRVAGSFRRGRALLLGDAAHIHSPVGGQGMNTGIGDAINLAWKLAMVLEGRAPEELLASYEVERAAFAHRLVATTDRVFTFVNADGPIARVVRTRAAPAIIPRVMKLHAVREFLFRTVSQLTLNYRGMPLSAGVAGKVHGGDRLPWTGAAEGDNFGSLAQIGWQVHVYGDTQRDGDGALGAWCAQHGVPLLTFPRGPAAANAGLGRNALYLLRPDAYVALAHPVADAAALEHYFAGRGMRPGGAESAAAVSPRRR
jgi:2-polyprenyl-6-methoxyphenol hydroxylase-like FAD-dependent oxidoreductase